MLKMLDLDVPITEQGAFIEKYGDWKPSNFEPFSIKPFQKQTTWSKKQLLLRLLTKQKNLISATSSMQPQEDELLFEKARGGTKRKQRKSRNKDHFHKK